MELSTSSISNEIDKSIQEEFSVSQAAIDDIKLRKEKGEKPESLSNEEIKKGDPILDTYKVLDDAIHGGMGSVWKVHHESWNVDLAMKRPQPRFFAEAGDGRKEEFIRECENWINLGLHPNIVSCYYVREIGGVPTIFSEWMDNGSLKDRIRDGSLYQGTEEEIQARILDIAIQAARGLQYSHENRLIHQDVKPGNILLTKTWDAKAADFGLAKAQSQLTENEKPVSTGYTKEYAPREQAEGAPAEKWMDVYAWALTVLEMYCGRRLWETGAEAKEHCREYFSRCRIPLSATLQELITRCLTETVDDFLPVGNILLDEYKEAFRRKYPRPVPKAAADSSDSLNNMALSFLDLGVYGKAGEIFDKADALNKNNKTVYYNRLLFQWRSGQRSDMGTLREFQANGTLLLNEEEYYLALAQLYCENGDYKKAMELAEQHESEAAEWAALLEYLMTSQEIAAFEQAQSKPAKQKKIIVNVADAKNLSLVNLSLPPRKQTMLLPAYVNNLEYGLNCMVSPDEKQLVTVSDTSRTVQVWDTKTGKFVKRDVCRIYGRFSEVKFSTDSKLLIVCSNQMVQAFSAEDKYTQLYQFQFDETPFSAAFAGRRNLMIVGFAGGRVCSYSLPDCTKIREYHVGDNNQDVNSVDITPDGSLALCCYGRSELCLMELPGGKCIQTYERHQKSKPYIHTVRFSENWTAVLYDATDLNFTRGEFTLSHPISPRSYKAPMRLAEIKDTVTQAQEANLLEELLTKAEAALREAKPREAAAVLEKARQLTGSQNFTRICKLNEQLSQFGKVSGIRAIWQESHISVGNDRKYFFEAVDSRGRIYLSELINHSTSWKLSIFEQNKEMKLLMAEMSPSSLKDLVFSPDEKTAYVYAYSYVRASSVYISETTGTGTYHRLNCDADVSEFDLSRDGKRIAVRTKEGEVRIFECQTGKQLPHSHYEEGMCYVRFCGDTSVYIVTDHKNMIWDFVTDRVLREDTEPIYLHFRPVISPDNRFAAVFSAEKNGIELRDLKTGKIKIRCETTIPDKMEFIRKGRFLVTQKIPEKEAAFWDTETGECIYRFSGGTLPADKFFFTQDGQRVYAIHDKNEITSWYIDYIYSLDD